MSMKDPDSDGSWIESDSENLSEPVTLEIENESTPDVENCIRQVKKSVLDVLHETQDVGLTQNIVRVALKQNWNGPRKTGSMLEPMQNHVTTESDMEIEQDSSSEESNTIPYEDSKLPSEISKAAELDSLNLLINTSRHLFGLMRSVTGPLPSQKDGNPFKMLEVDRVNAAVGCAKQLYSIMRLQLDATKMMRDKQ